jgi:hypothetical protein
MIREKPDEHPVLVRESIARLRRTSRLAICQRAIYSIPIAHRGMKPMQRIAVNGISSQQRTKCVASRRGPPIRLPLFTPRKSCSSTRASARLATDQVRLFSMANRTSSAEVRTPSFWRMIEDVLATVLYDE